MTDREPAQTTPLLTPHETVEALTRAVRLDAIQVSPWTLEAIDAAIHHLSRFQVAEQTRHSRRALASRKPEDPRNDLTPQDQLRADLAVERQAMVIAQQQRDRATIWAQQLAACLAALVHNDGTITAGGAQRILAEAEQAGFEARWTGRAHA